MHDDFLKQYRKQPDQAFTEALYRKVQMEKRRVSTMKRLSLALVCLLAAFGIALGVSPQARGAALELIREVGGLRFMETSDYPGKGGKTEIVESTYLPLEEAMLIFPGTISLPSALPEGYSLDPEVQLTDFEGGNLPIAEVNWRKTNPEGGWSSLSLGIAYLTEQVQDLARVVGEGAIEEVTINGKPAALIRGGWNYDAKSFDPTIQPSLRWEYDERTIYELHSSDEAIGREVLIRIAESIP